jgi:uncharacterized protein
MPNMSFAVSAAWFEGALAVLAVCIGWALNRPPMETFRLNWIGLGWGILATLPPLVLFWLCVKTPWRPLSRIVEVLDDSVVPLFCQCRIFELAIIALLAGLGEEMLFRGIVQAWVADKVGAPYGLGLGLGIAAVIFGLFHSITPTYAILAGCIGLYLGAIWLATDNLLVPITCHALYDFLALLYFTQLRKSKSVSLPCQGPPENGSV